jgi:hypothetical protein
MACLCCGLAMVGTCIDDLISSHLYDCKWIHVTSDVSQDCSRVIQCIVKYARYVRRSTISLQPSTKDDDFKDRRQTSIHRTTHQAPKAHSRIRLVTTYRASSPLQVNINTTNKETSQNSASLKGSTRSNQVTAKHRST